ncbi:energy transducer TonB [uncultured Croceitalea sp.]|uniref:energy transducer TonB n=1 Tax=uncultured Croceitalea sp. TaxID=1798908 RepID=UPI00330598A5
MEAKKKEHLKLEKNSSLYFVIGLTLILALIYTALEWKTFYSEPDWEITQNILDNIDEDVPITVHYMKPPPPKIITPPEIKVVDDDKDIIETIIEAIDPNQDTEIMEISNVNLEEVEEDVTVLIDLIDEVPIFPGCEDAIDKKACFQKMMTKHVNKNIRYPDLAMEMNIQGRVSTQFIIGKDGTIENLKMRGPHQVLEKEAKRIVSKLPKMTPGKHQGKNAKVVFSLPITFRLQ